MNVFLCSQHSDLVKRWTEELNEHYTVTAVNELTALESKIKTAGNLLILHVPAQLDDEPLLMRAIAHWRSSQFVLLLADVPNEEQGIRLLRQGARGYANAYMNGKRLNLAIQALAAGEIWVSPGLLDQLFQLIQQDMPVSQDNIRVDDDCAGLVSPRERDIVGLVMAGESNKEIAKQLAISERTVKAHLTHIFQKLGVRNRLELSVRCRPRH